MYVETNLLSLVDQDICSQLLLVYLYKSFNCTLFIVESNNDNLNLIYKYLELSTM